RQFVAPGPAGLRIVHRQLADGVQRVRNGRSEDRRAETIPDQRQLEARARELSRVLPLRTVEHTVVFQSACIPSGIRELLHDAGAAGACGGRTGAPRACSEIGDLSVTGRDAAATTRYARCGTRATRRRRDGCAVEPS